jgi:NADH-quinone oxidoreductase subunit K
MLLILYFSILLLLIGIVGLYLTRKHAIMMLIALELLILSVNINFIISSVYLDDLLGIIYSLINLTSAASESAIGLALLIIYYRIKGSISLDLISYLKS